MTTVGAPRVQERTPAQATVERLVPERMAGRIIHAEHIARYVWAGSIVAGKDVLDAGCGVGYGAQMLMTAGAASAAGIDVSPEVIAHASSRLPEIEFAVAELAQLPFPDASFDVVVCFEVIEHVTGPERAIAELRRVLRPGGVLLLSTPNADVHPLGNEHHVQEFVPEELERLVLGSFARCRLQRQHLWAVSLIGGDGVLGADDPAADLGASAHKLSARQPGQETFTVAIASDGPLPDPKPVAMLIDTMEVRLWQERLDELRGEMRSAYGELEASRGREAQLVAESRNGAEALREASRQAAECHGLRDELLSVREELRCSCTEHEELRRSHAARQAERSQIEQRLQDARAELAETGAQLHVALQWLQVIQGSASWRLTAPLRLVLRLVRRVTGRTDPAGRHLMR